jgi:hypothetical protein
MTYKIRPFHPTKGLGLTPKVAKHEFAEKRGHEEGKKLIENKVKQIKDNPKAFNGKKALFYFKDEELEDREILKIVPEDYASVSTALEINRNKELLNKDQFLRSHFSAGVIVLCKTSDNKIIIGSRDAARNKEDPTKYPLQFPCGFIDVNDSFYQDMQKKDSANLLNKAIVSDAKRELTEEVLGFSNSEIIDAKIIAAIYDTKQWPVKEEKGGGEKNVHVIKSFVVALNVDMTYKKIKKRRSEVPPKDFNEMTVMGYIEIDKIPELLSEKENGTKVAINFDGKERLFVAEHGLTLDAVSQYYLSLSSQKIDPDSSIKPYSSERGFAPEQKLER